MNTFFDGKVQVRSLLVTDQPANRKEIVARLLSPGGELTVLTDGIAPIRHLNYVELREGKLRGNHYHKLRHETFYVIVGELELRLRHLATGEAASVPMRAGDMASIAPGVVHTFVPSRCGHGLEFAPEPFDATDVYRLNNS